MCLGIPALVVTIKDDEAVVDVAGARRRVSAALTEGVKEGDYVIIHAGFIIQKIDTERAEETLKMLRTIGTGP
ncbi:MAG TPA: HypC/HybG/HupF family hydrogenase formation chaperone [Deltaproteobacteria bacterium]|nr:HypC/HybG/HupF family hydrogenase formation chaperone [Deltaproteobacteria bacterium]